MKLFFTQLHLSVKSLLLHSGRTVLTLLGIVIAIAAITIVIAIGESVRGFVIGEIQSFGTDIVQVEIKIPSAGAVSAENVGGLAQGVQITTLTREDAEAILKLPNVVTYNAGILGQAQAQAAAETTRTTLLGSSADAPRVDKNISVSHGRFFTQSDEESAAQVVVLGFNSAEELFGASNPVGERIKLGGQSYRVVGVLDERGSTGFFSFDDVIYVPITTMQKKILGIDHLSFFTVLVEDQDRILHTRDDIQILLRSRHGSRGEEFDDFSVTTVQELQETLDTVLGAMNILLIALASISLIVGGVGIMNVLLVSVAERIREIGLRKAVGARRDDVIVQFLGEAVLLGFFGGVIGLLLGGLIIYLIVLGFQANDISLNFTLPLWAPFLAIAFSALTGIIFGIYPAVRASSISPIEAIRKE